MSNFKYFKDSEIIGLDTRLVSMLDCAREKAGIPFIITSGLRTADQNAKVGGVSDSAHLKGLAVDIFCPNSTNRYKILKSLLEVGFTRIELCSRHVHADIDSMKQANVIILENSN